jgi:tellurite resistance protein TerC
LIYFWIIFNVCAVAALALDMKWLRHAGRAVGFREALLRSGVWVLVAAAFAVLLRFWFGHQTALEFVTGYVIELSLSVDNLFVFLLVFRYFAVPEEQQPRVLFWGILGALLMRGVFIWAGIGLLHRFHAIVYVFGALLIFSGIRLLAGRGRPTDPSKSLAVKLVRGWLPVTDQYSGGKFFVRSATGAAVTPLLLVLLVIETTDLLFAVDSIPAVLSITLNAFVVYTSNVLAILGLRSLYFAVAGLMKKFRFLHYGLAMVLILTGLKMLLAERYPVSTLTTLSMVAATLGTAVLISLAWPGKAEVAGQ